MIALSGRRLWTDGIMRFEAWGLRFEIRSPLLDPRSSIPAPFLDFLSPSFFFTPATCYRLLATLFYLDFHLGPDVRGQGLGGGAVFKGDLDAAVRSGQGHDPVLRGVAVAQGQAGGLGVADVDGD